MSPVSRIHAFSLAASVLVLDFLTKRYVLAHQGEFSAGIPVIDGLVQFTYVRNAGAAFGMFQGGRWPFIVVSALTVMLLTYVLLRGRTRRLRGHAYALILAGAAGNLIDRIFYEGLVVDFILLTYRGSSFPVFNVADMGVSFGAALLVWSMLRGEHEEARVASEPPAPDSQAATSSTDVQPELDP